ncbi:uncharacterized protein K460DRAFT_359503 [Cucurbitaria berberidis CBS 394.84]|uniref:Uncharacterized protein n=1 Tax=Cucurbitaria berberidis CBS 394.84 TaxID=1168544 RepID=A0A9P4G8D8_9PLEO|nr:uncharacterized protein K460DRAFT_359503 [Cucurbitaria berberidis CBS 394.84]KAF1840963.1 hypothetical protein K460DRAFT_359503 [Cucurbitaria berberidis CBS 394.84]
MASYIAASPFLGLPRELRYEIYEYLCGTEPRSYPFKAPPIASFDQTPPPTNLQLTCRYIYEEIRTYFHGRVTLRFVTRSFSQETRNHIHSLALTAIRQAKKVELVLVWDIPLGLVETEWGKWPWAMNGWLDEQVSLLLDEGKNLESVVVSIRDVSENVDWEKKTMILKPLSKLKARVRFQSGEITAADREEEALRGHLGKYLRDLNKRRY